MMFSVALNERKATKRSETRRRKEEREEGEENEHERKLLRDSSSDDLGVDDETLEDVLESAENDVGGEEGFGKGDSSVGAANERRREGEVRFETRRGSDHGERTHESSRVRSNH